MFKYHIDSEQPTENNIRYMNFEGTVHDFDCEMDVTYRIFGILPTTTAEEEALIEQFVRKAQEEGCMTTFKVRKIVAVIVE